MPKGRGKADGVARKKDRCRLQKKKKGGLRILQRL